MKKTLQDQYLLIKEGKGHKGVFLTEAKREFPHIVRNAATFDEAVASLKTKNIISENVISVMPAIMDRPKKESYETAFEAFLAEAKKKNEDEKVKAEEKKVSKPVEEDLAHNFDYSDEKNPDNMIFDQIMMGYYAEMKDPKNADKTMQELKDIVFKNLQKDQIYYTKNAQFGVKDLGYTTEAPGLGEPKEPKGKYKSSGYGDLKEGVEKKFVSDIEDLVTKKKDSKFTDKEIKAKLAQKRKEELERRKKAGESLEEIMLREVVQNMIFEELNSEEFEDTLFKLEQPHLGDKEALTTIQKIYSRHSAGLNSISQNIEESDVDEAYQMPSVNTSGRGGEGGRRFIPNQLPFPQNIRKRFGEHIIYNPGSLTLYISDILYNNLVKGYGDQPAIKKLIMDIPPMVKQILNKPDNYGPTTELPKEFRVYHPLNAEVEKAKADKFNKAGDKQYWAESDFLIPNLNIMEEGLEEASLGVIDNDVAPARFLNLPISYSDDKNVAHYSDDYEYGSQDDLLDVEDYLDQIKGMSKGDAFDYLKEMGLERDEILTVLRNHKSSSLRESVEKDLADINKEAEHEVLQAKLDKIDALIDHRRSKLSKLDEDEDMKALTDKKKVKELEKDIKKLEVARKKVEKMMSKFKGKKKEVIDEVEDLDVNDSYVEDATERLDAGQDVDNIIDTYDNMALDQKDDLDDYLNDIAPDDQKSDYVS
jgi:hypothetical protein